MDDSKEIPLTHDFVAYIDRTVGQVRISIDVGISVPGGNESPEWAFAEHLIGFLRAEIEGAIAHIETMRAIQEMFDRNPARPESDEEIMARDPLVSLYGAEQVEAWKRERAENRRHTEELEKRKTLSSTRKSLSPPPAQNREP
jgi:hypothetical protein